MRSPRLVLALSFVVAVTARSAHADPPPSDLQIAHIAYTADLIDIRYAHIALAISDNPVVREFAETMLRDHTAFNQSALALAGKLKITPEDNPTSQTLLKNASAKNAELLTLRAAAFDRAYAANELAYHQFVNKAVADSFIPAARNKDLKALLGKALVTFKGHELHAEHMVSGLK